MKKLLALITLLLLSTPAYAAFGNCGFGDCSAGGGSGGGDVIASITETASTETFGVENTITSPLSGSVSGAVQIGSGTQLTTTETGSLTGTGHTLALFGRNIHNGSGTLPLQIGAEGILQNTNGGAVGYGAIVAANMNSLTAGSTYTLLAGFSPIYDGIAAPGSITTLADFYSADHSGIANIPATRYSLLNLDSSKIIYSTGPIVASSITTASSTDPYSIYDVSTATDYDYWSGVSSNNNNTADTGDYWTMGTGTTPFSNNILKVFNTGGTTWGDGTSSTLTFKWHTAYTTADPSQILTSTAGSVKSSTTGWVGAASASSQVLYDMQGTFNGALTSTAIGYGQRSKWTLSGAASNEIYSFTGDAQMTNTSGTQAEVAGIYGWGTRNGAGGTTTTFYGVKGEAATVTAGTLTNNYAGGFEGRVRFFVDSQTIADNGNGGTAATLTLNPAYSIVEITCSDAQGCDVTMGETGVLDGTPIKIYNLSANAVNFADTAGVTELTGAVALGQYDSLTITYVQDRWIMDSTSNN